MSRVLLTGGAGFIGSHLARRLLKDGHEVDIVDNLRTGARANLPSGARFTELDLGLPENLRRLPGTGYDAILHLAGQSSGEKSFDDPLHDLDANARSTVALAQWAIQNRVPTFLHASSMGVYGDPGPRPVAEDAPPRPLSYYGASKHGAELALGVAASRGLRTVSFRMFNVYGPGQRLQERRQGMIRIYLSYLLRGEPLEVKGGLDRVRDFVYIDDVVDAWMRALTKPAQGVFNLGTGVGTTVRQLVAQLLETTGLRKDHPVRELPSTPGDAKAVVADIAAAKRDLGWAPKVPLRVGLERTVAWARNALEVIP